MTIRTRVFLIAIGVILFAILTPVAILFARGFRYDWDNHRLVKTGTLVIKTQPRDAIVYLNGKALADQTPLSKRFLLPGEYSVEIKKDGFHDWKKRVTIHEQAVTSLPASRSETIFLLLQNPITMETTTSTMETLFMSPAKTIGENYYISPDTRRLMLKSSGDAEAVEILSQTLPQFSKSQIIVTDDKLIFLLLDQDLYLVSEDLKKINGGVKYANWRPDDKALVYGNDHEIWLYQSLAEPAGKLITRSLQNLGATWFNKKTSYLFVAEEQQIKAIEVDTSGQPNVYVLVETKNPVSKLRSTPEGSELIYQENNEITRLKIR